MGSDAPLYKVTTGHPLTGPSREYKTERGARRAATAQVATGKDVTLWKGTLHPRGGWRSWSAIPLEEEEPTAPYCEACDHHHDGRCLCPDCGRPVNDPGATHARCPA